MHALLKHLYEAGFRAAPRPLGIDDQGREVLTYAPGTVMWPGRLALLDPQPQLARVAHLIRDFHDAVQDFVPPPEQHQEMWARALLDGDSR